MSPPATADKKQSAFAPKQNLSSGHKLSPAQTSTVPQNLQNNIVVIPALSQPSFGSFFLVNVATHGVQVENISLQFQVNALFPNSGLTYVGAGISGSATTPFQDEIPFYSPSSLWIDHVEVTCNNIILDTIYGPSIHNLKKNLEKLDFLKDELAILPEFDEETASDNLFYFTFVVL